MPTSWTKADRRLRGALLALTLALLALTSSPPQPAAAAADPADAYRTALLRELNRVRAAKGLPVVRRDAGLDRGATAHSRDMARKRYFAHGRWTARVRAAAGRARSVGEVIGWLTPSSPRSEAAAIVRSWLDSPTHRAVVLDRGFGRVGVGRATGGQRGASAALYTADFASTS